MVVRSWCREFKRRKNQVIRFPRYLASTIRCDRHPVKLENAEFSSVADDQKGSLLLSVVVPQTLLLFKDSRFEIIFAMDPSACTGSTVSTDYSKIKRYIVNHSVNTVASVRASPTLRSMSEIWKRNGLTEWLGFSLLRSLPLGQSAICKGGRTFHLERFMAYWRP